MRNASDGRARILVVQDVEETRDGLEKLLEQGDGYRVDAARTEDDAIVRAQRAAPPVVSQSWEAGRYGHRRGPPHPGRAGVRAEVPVVIFCSEAVAEGEEVALGNRVYVTRPDNFNQLRRFLGRLSPHYARHTLGGRPQPNNRSISCLTTW